MLKTQAVNELTNTSLVASGRLVSSKSKCWVWATWWPGPWRQDGTSHSMILIYQQINPPINDHLQGQPTRKGWYNSLIYSMFGPGGRRPAGSCQTVGTKELRLIYRNGECSGISIGHMVLVQEMWIMGRSDIIYAPRSEERCRWSSPCFLSSRGVGPCLKIIFASPPCTWMHYTETTDFWLDYSFRTYLPYRYTIWSRSNRATWCGAACSLFRIRPTAAQVLE
jgi:hypothetical protein